MRALSFFFLSSLLLVGCSTQDEPGCAAGSTQPCMCAGGASGVQTCRSDGTYGSCVCGAGDAGGMDAGGGRDAGGRDAGDIDAGGGMLDGGGGDGATSDASRPDAAMSDAGSESDSGAAGCAMGTPAPIGQLCVVEASIAGGPVQFQVMPMGCFSSSCTIRHETTCSVSRSGTNIDLSARFCLAGTGDPICTADCNGGGFAQCSETGVEAGSYTATLGALSVSFTVPSTIPPGGICDGSPF